MSCLGRHVSCLVQSWNRVALSHPQNVLSRWKQTEVTSCVRPVTYAMRKISFLTKMSHPNKHFDGVSTTKVASNIELRKVERSECTCEMNNYNKTKSLVIILFPFSMASKSVVKKYCSLYHSFGLDVLAVRGHLLHSLHPGSGRTLAKQILGYLTQNETPLNTEKFVFHSVSFGDYLYALMLNEMTENPRKYNATKRKISGQIFDSVTSGVPTASAFPVPILGRWLQYIMDKSVGLYWLALSNHRDFREKVLDVFKRGPVQGNALVFCSFDDPLSDVQSVDKIIEGWRRERSTDVAVSSWTASEHGRHFLRYPEQYSRAIHTFLTKLHVVPSTRSPEHPSS